LEQYKGCVIVDICPGAGLWSSKLHDHLKPRSHILVEPSFDEYSPSLTPLLEKAGSTYRYVKADPLARDTFTRIMQQDILQAIDPHQVDAKKPLPNNRSILVIANLFNLAQNDALNKSFSARKFLSDFATNAWGGPKDLAALHSRGPVRMLAWMNASDESSVLPRSVGARSSYTAKIESIAQVVEVAGPSRNAIANKEAPREAELEFESSQSVVHRMIEKGISFPEHRKDNIFSLAWDTISDHNRIAGRKRYRVPPKFHEDFIPQFVKYGTTSGFSSLNQRAYEESFTALCTSGKFPTIARKGHQLANKGEISEFDPDSAAWKAFHKFLKAERRQSKLRKTIEPYVELSKQILEVETKLSDPSSTIDNPNPPTKDLIALLEDLKAKRALLAENHHVVEQSIAEMILDDYHALHLQPPNLSWDRRPFEPLLVLEDEFMMRSPLILIDIQPYAPTAPPAEAAQDASYHFDFLNPFFSKPGRNVQQALESLCPGAGDEKFGLCSPDSLVRDVKRGGRRDVRDLRVRMLGKDALWDLSKRWRTWEGKPPGSDTSSWFARTMKRHDKKTL
jgi:mitochondrial transcription factor 1